MSERPFANKIQPTTPTTGSSEKKNTDSKNQDPNGTTAPPPLSPVKTLEAYLTDRNNFIGLALTSSSLPSIDFFNTANTIRQTLHDKEKDKLHHLIKLLIKHHKTLFPHHALEEIKSAYPGLTDDTIKQLFLISPESSSNSDYKIDLTEVVKAAQILTPIISTLSGNYTGVINFLQSLSSVNPQVDLSMIKDTWNVVYFNDDGLNPTLTLCEIKNNSTLKLTHCVQLSFTRFKLDPTLQKTLLQQCNCTPVVYEDLNQM